MEAALAKAVAERVNEMRSDIDVIVEPDIETLEWEEPRVMRISHFPSLWAYCRVGNAPFTVQAEITYVPDEKLLEFESFEKWLNVYVSAEQTTIEEVTVLIYTKLEEVLDPISLVVKISAETTVHAPVVVEMRST